MPRRDAKRFPRGQPSMENSKAPSPAGSKFRQAGGFFCRGQSPKGGRWRKGSSGDGLRNAQACCFLYAGRGPFRPGRDARWPDGLFESLPEISGNDKKEEAPCFLGTSSLVRWKGLSRALADSPQDCPPRPGRRATGRAVRVPSGDFRKQQKRRDSLFPWNLFFGAAEHSVSELLG